MKDLFHQIGGEEQEISFETFEKTFGPKFENMEVPIEALFNAIDKDKSSSISRQEFLSSMFLFGYSSIDEKLRFLFSMYDRDGNGHITKNELKEYIQECSETCQQMDFICKNLNGLSVLQDNHLISLSVDQVFEQLDLDDDGKISFDEFKKFAVEDANIQKFLTLMHNIVPYVSKGLKKSVAPKGSPKIATQDDSATPHEKRKQIMNSANPDNQFLGVPVMTRTRSQSLPGGNIEQISLVPPGKTAGKGGKRGAIVGQGRNTGPSTTNRPFPT